MNASSHAVRVALLGACLIGALSLAGGCSPKISAVDPSYTTPEGVANGTAQLLVYPDVPLVISTWDDNPELDPGTNVEVNNTWNPASPTDPGGDVLLSQQVFYQSAPGAVLGLIVDGSVASGFKVLRRESNGGLRMFQDQPVTASRRWLDSGAELYRFIDTAPSGYVPASYFGQGLVDGAVREGSPVTNEGRLAALDVADLTYTGATLPPDSLFVASWNPVAGADAYWVQVFEYLPAASANDRRFAAAPAPLSVPLTRDFFLAKLPAATTTYRIGDPGATVYTFQRSGFRRGRSYLVRVSAVDASGRLIAMTMGADKANAIVSPFGTGQLTVSMRGAIVVTP